MSAPTVSIRNSGGPTYFGIPVNLSCISLLPPSDDVTSFGVHVVWNLTFTENGELTTMSYPPMDFTGAPTAFVNTTFNYIFFSGDSILVSCSSTLSATRDGSIFISGASGVATTILHVVGESQDAT